MASGRDDFEKRVNDIWYHRYRADDRRYSQEQTRREIETLRRRLERSAADYPAAFEVDLEAVLLPHRMAREQLRQEIHSQQALVRDKIRGCTRLDRVIRRRWIDDLAEIELLEASAPAQVQQLKKRVEMYREDIAFHSGAGSLADTWNLKSDLGQVAHELWQLERLCAAYREKIRG